MRELTPPSEQAKIGKQVSKSLNPIFQPEPYGFAGKEEVGRYICTICPDDREMPGFEGVVAKWDRNKHGERAKELPFFYVLKEALLMPRKHSSRVNLRRCHILIHNKLVIFTEENKT